MGAKAKNNKYELEYNGQIYLIKTLYEASKITGRSVPCINRINQGSNKFKKAHSHELVNIKIKRITAEPIQDLEVVPV